MSFNGLILIWPYDTADLLAVLPNNDACPKPCWQGIRPGTTTLGEALELLRPNGWIGQISFDDSHIEWAWSGQQPPAVDGTRPGQIDISEGVVSAVHLTLNIGMGDLAILFGNPHWHITHHANASAIIRLSYPRDYLTLSVTMRCPARRSTFWLAQPEIILQGNFAAGSRFTPEILGYSVAC